MIGFNRHSLLHLDQRCTHLKLLFDALGNLRQTRSHALQRPLLADNNPSQESIAAIKHGSLFDCCAGFNDDAVGTLSWTGIGQCIFCSPKVLDQLLQRRRDDI